MEKREANMKHIAIVFISVVCAFPAWAKEALEVQYERIRIPEAIRELDHMSEETATALKWYFCASRDWAVTYKGACVAEKRWNGGAHRPPYAPPSNSVLRLRFSSWLDASPSPFATIPTSVQAGDDYVDLAVCPHFLMQPLGWRSQLTLRCNGLMFVEITEISPDATRTGTVEQLQRLSELVSFVDKGRGAMESALIEDGSIILDDGASMVAGVRLVQDNQGEHDMEGYANAGVEGYLQAEFTKANEGEIQWPPSYRIDSKEWIGWDGDLRKKFFFRIHIDDVVGGDGNECNAVYRLRFFPRNVQTVFKTNGVIRTIKPRSIE